MGAIHGSPSRFTQALGASWTILVSSTIGTKHLSNSITLVDSQVMVKNSSIGKLKGI